MKKLLYTFALAFFAATAYSQITIAPNISFSQCPGVSIVYTANNVTTNACIFDWTVTNGTITGGLQDGNTSTFSGGNLITVVWADATTGTIKVKVRNCSPPDYSETTYSYAILSLKGVTPESITGTNPTVNATNNVVYEVPRIKFATKGGSEPNYREVNNYEWEIPSGWTIISGENTHSITVKPDNCSGGTIRVRGKSTICPDLAYYSNWSPVKTITRPIAAPGAISGPDVVECYNTSVNLYSIPAVPGATSYSWTIPSGWSGSSTTTSIDVTPNGLNGGTISVRAHACSIQSAPVTKNVTLVSFNPDLLSITPGIVCSSTTLTLANQPAGPSFTWSSGNSNALSVDPSSGFASRVNGYKGVVAVTASRAAQGSCNALSVTDSIIVGPPREGHLSDIQGPGMVTDFNILYPYFVSNTGATSYSWSVSNTNLLEQRFTSLESQKVTLSVQRFLNQEGVVNISVSLANDCGSSVIGPRPIRVGPCPGNFNNTGCGEIIERRANNWNEELNIFPNPASNEIIIKLHETDLQDETEFTNQPITVTLFNLKGEVVYTAQYTYESIAISVRDIPAGQYIALIKRNGKESARSIHIER
jgi:hypothetical protein